MVDENWVPDGIPQPSSDEREDFRAAAAKLGLTVTAVTLFDDEGEPTVYRIAFGSFADAYRLVIWAQDAGLYLRVEGPRGFAAFRARRQSNGEAGLYAVLLPAADLPGLTARLRNPAEDWDAYPHRRAIAWARWSR